MITSEEPLDLLQAVTDNAKVNLGKESFPNCYLLLLGLEVSTSPSTLDLCTPQASATPLNFQYFPGLPQDSCGRVFRIVFF